MNAVDNIFHTGELRQALASFWSESLSVEPLKNGSGVALALPQTLADGWQVVVEIESGPPGKVRLTDSGRTLGQLMALGQNVEADKLGKEIGGILHAAHAERSGWEIYRWLSLPVEPVEIHVFGEALVAVSHLRLLHEPLSRTQDIADQTLRRVFADSHVEAKPGATLDGKTERKVKVDYLTMTRLPVAFNILRRRGNIFPVMEQWGYRWQDLRKVNPSLMAVMLYDPASQEVDEASRAIGEEVCSLFCAYDETDRIHATLNIAKK